MKKTHKTRAPALLFLVTMLLSLCVLPAHAADSERIMGINVLRNGKTTTLFQAATENAFPENGKTGFAQDVDYYVAYTLPGSPVTIRAEAAEAGSNIQWRIRTETAGLPLSAGSWTDTSGTAAGRWSSYEVTPEEGKDTYLEISANGLNYNVKVVSAEPHVDLRFYNGIASQGVARGQVLLSGAKMLNMSFTLQGKGGAVATGLSDQAGTAIFNYKTDGITRVDVLTGKGYGANGAETNAGDGLTAGVEKDGWTAYSAGDQEWFSYNSALVELTGVSYDVATESVMVSLNTKEQGGDMPSLDTTAAAQEVFRFYYGLAEGQNGTGLEAIFETDNEADDFRIVNVDGIASNMVYDSRLGAVTVDQVGNLVELKLVKTITEVTAGWGEESNPVLSHATDSFEDTAEKGKNFDVDVTHYTLRTLSGKAVSLEAIAGEDGNELKWQTAVTEINAGITGAAWSDLSATVSETTKSKVSLTPAEGKDTYVKLEDVLGNLYYIRLRPMQPEVRIRFYSGKVGDKASNGTVVIDQTELKSLTFSMEAKGGTESSGLTDQDGSAILNFTGDAKYVDLVHQKAYTSAGADATVEGTYPTLTAADKNGWASYSLAGKEWFSFDAGKVEVTGLNYYLTEKTLVVTLTAKDGQDLPGSVDSTEGEVELFRFWYGLKTGKTGWGLKDIFTTAETNDDFRLVEVTGTGAENAIVDNRAGTINLKDVSDLVKLVLIPRTSGTIEVIVDDSATAYQKIHWSLYKINPTAESDAVLPVLQSQDLLETDVTGIYAISLLLEEAGDYRLVVTGQGYLPVVYLIPGVDPEKSDRLQGVETAKLLAGKVTDANQWSITLADRTAFVTTFGKRKSDLPSDNLNANTLFTLCDFTEDDTIDGLDLGILIDNMGAASNGDDKDVSKLMTAYDYKVLPVGAAAEG